MVVELRRSKIQSVDLIGAMDRQKCVPTGPKSPTGPKIPMAMRWP